MVIVTATATATVTLVVRLGYPAAMAAATVGAMAEATKVGDKTPY